MFKENRRLFRQAPGGAPAEGGPVEGGEIESAPPEVIETQELIEQQQDVGARVTDIQMQFGQTKLEIVADISALIANPDTPMDQRNEMNALVGEIYQALDEAQQFYTTQLFQNAIDREAISAHALGNLAILVENVDIAGNASELQLALSEFMGAFVEQNQTVDMAQALQVYQEFSDFIGGHEVHGLLGLTSPLNKDRMRQMMEHVMGERFLQSPAYLQAPPEARDAFRAYLFEQIDHNLRVQDSADGFGDAATEQDIEYWFTGETPEGYGPHYSTSSREYMGFAPDKKPDTVVDGEEVFAVHAIPGFDRWQAEAFERTAGKSVEEVRKEAKDDADGLNQILENYKNVDAELEALGQNTTEIKQIKEAMSGTTESLRRIADPETPLYHTQWMAIKRQLTRAGNLATELADHYAKAGLAILESKKAGFDELGAEHELVTRRDELKQKLTAGETPIEAVVDLAKAVDAEIETRRQAAEGRELYVEGGEELLPEEPLSEEQKQLREQQREVMRELKSVMGPAGAFATILFAKENDEPATEEELEELGRLGEFLSGTQLFTMGTGQEEKFFDEAFTIKKLDKGIEITTEESKFFEEGRILFQNQGEAIHFEVDSAMLTLNVTLNPKALEEAMEPFLQVLEENTEGKSEDDLEEIRVKIIRGLMKFMEKTKSIEDLDLPTAIAETMSAFGEDVFEFFLGEERGQIYAADTIELVNILTDSENRNGIAVGGSKTLWGGALTVKRTTEDEIRINMNNGNELELPDGEIVIRQDEEMTYVSVNLPGLTIESEVSKEAFREMAQERLRARGDHGVEDDARDETIAGLGEGDQPQSTSHPSGGPSRSDAREGGDDAEGREGVTDERPADEAETVDRSRRLEVPNEEAVRAEKEKILSNLKRFTRPDFERREYEKFVYEYNYGDLNRFEGALSPEWKMREMKPGQRRKKKREAIEQYLGHAAGRPGVEEANTYVAATRYLNRQIQRAQEQGFQFYNRIEDLNVVNVVNLLAQAACYAENPPSQPGEYKTESVLLEAGGNYSESGNEGYQIRYRVG